MDIYKYLRVSLNLRGSQKSVLVRIWGGGWGWVFIHGDGGGYLSMGSGMGSYPLPSPRPAPLTSLMWNEFSCDM